MLYLYQNTSFTTYLLQKSILSNPFLVWSAFWLLLLQRWYVCKGLMRITFKNLQNLLWKKIPSQYNIEIYSCCPMVIAHCRFPPWTFRLLFLTKNIVASDNLVIITRVPFCNNVFKSRLFRCVWMFLQVGKG